MGSLVGRGGEVVGAVKSQLAVAEGGIDEGAVMRAGWIVVPKWLKEAARHAHAGNWNPALLLKGADHRDEGAQEGGLLGVGEFSDRLEQKVGPGGSGGRFATASRREDDDYSAAVPRCRFLGHQALAVQGSDAVGGGGGSDAELFCQGPQAQSARIGPQQRQHLALCRGQAPSAGLGPGLLLEGNADFGQPNRHPSVERLLGRQSVS